MKSKHTKQLARQGGNLGGRPTVYSRRAVRKSIAFLATANDELEFLSQHLRVSYADVLHLGLLKLSKEAGSPSSLAFHEELCKKADVMGHKKLTAAIPAP